VLVLLAEPGAVFDRRRQFRPAELGMHAGYADLGRDSFVEYQAKGSANLVRLGESRGWQSLVLDPGLPIEHTIDRLTTVISDLLAAAPLGRT
jgi:hypothetical protein